MAVGKQPLICREVKGQELQRLSLSQICFCLVLEPQSSSHYKIWLFVRTAFWKYLLNMFWLCEPVANVFRGSKVIRRLVQVGVCFVWGGQPHAAPLCHMKTPTVPVYLVLTDLRSAVLTGCGRPLSTETLNWTLTTWKTNTEDFSLDSLNIISLWTERVTVCSHIKWCFHEHQTVAVMKENMCISLWTDVWLKCVPVSVRGVTAQGSGCT